ncbi:MAG: alpha-glucosidase C-terminal domain-containing protein [Bacteroidetes bacterium]|nr:alpha-glucosidase C-terminal domain-containing protein [Bacteroidota bacterium]
MQKKIFYLVVVFLSICVIPVSAQNKNGNIKSDTTTIRHPLWSYQSNMYEVNLRQYTSAGTFKAFAKSLPRLKKMGVEILWFMPITPIGLEGRKSSPADLGSYYAVKDYYAVNPDYGTLDDFKALVIQAHAMGFKVITDWVPNHTSPDNPWIKNHPDFYKKDSLGQPAIPFDWSDTRQLDYNNPELRDSMTAAMKWWLTNTDIDGFRCDVAWNVPDDYWKVAIAQLHKIKNVFMLAEGEKPGLHLAGFDETYPWSVMNVAYGIYSGKTNIHQLDSIIDYNAHIYPKNVFRLYFTTNHDENSWNGTEFERFGEGYKTFAVWAFTMRNSVPLIYSGQEEPNKKRLQFFVKDTIEWKHYALASFYRTLNKLRRANPALAANADYKRIKVGDENSVFAYLRQKGNHKVLVILNFSGAEQTVKLKEAFLKGSPLNVFSEKHEKLGPSVPLHVEPWGYLLYDYNAK